MIPFDESLLQDSRDGTSNHEASRKQYYTRYNEWRAGTKEGKVIKNWAAD